MIHRRHRNLFTRGLLLVTSYSLLVTIFGCDAFVRKFTRKPKKEDLPQEEMVLAPQEYKAPQMSNTDLYHKYFLYWQSWHDELMESLLENLSHRKRVDCAEQALKNLVKLKHLLKPEKQKQLDEYIQRLEELKETIDSDVYGTNNRMNYLEARRLKLDIIKYFLYPEVKNDLI